MSIRLFLLIPAIALCIGLLPHSAECKTLYRYKDASGTVCYTDDLKSIPAKLQKNAVPFTPAEVPTTAPPANPVIPPANPAIPPAVAPPVAIPPAMAGAVAMAQDYWQNPFIRGGAFLLGAFIGLLFLFKLLEYIPSRNLGRLILLIFFLGTGIFGYKLFVERMVQSYATAKAETTKVVEKENQRQRVLQKNLQALD